MSDTSFLGRGWSFPPSFTRQKKRIVMVSEEEDIEESHKILLSTTPGERIMQPDFGCNLRKLIYEEFSLSAQTMAREMIRRAILFFEPRITVTSINFVVDKENCSIVKIQICYIIRSSNTRFNMVYPFYLQEGTGIQIK
jgi:phage baseplate assembly protein W